VIHNDFKKKREWRKTHAGDGEANFQTLLQLPLSKTNFSKCLPMRRVLNCKNGIHQATGFVATEGLVQPKINLKKVENLRPSKSTIQTTTIHHAITTISPANYHQKTLAISITPLKNTSKTTKIDPPGPQIFFSQNC
jgi:hypothetical protein